MPHLVVYKGPALQGDYSFPGHDLILIGRAMTNDIVLDSHNASRQHAALVRSVQGNAQYFIRDLGSLHTTRVGGESVDRRLLRDGDVIQIANYRLVYSSHAEPSSKADLIRVVPRKLDAGSSQLITRSSAPGSIEHPSASPFTAEMQELLEHFEKRGQSGVTLSALLYENTAAVLQVLQAERGFVRLLGSDDSQSHHDVAVIGLDSGAGIEISNGAFMDYLLEGKCVRDGATLLAPLMDRDKTLGFFCLDRRPPARAFCDEDTAFLVALGRCATASAKSDCFPAARSAGSEPPLEWGVQIIGKSKKMQELLQGIQKAAVGDANILLAGETGTGKELVAHAVHLHSSCSRGPFIARHCRQTTESLAETEIFGYVPKSGIAGANPEGAPGWFEMAEGGTLFLDEIQSLSPSMQDMFLRALQQREVRRFGARHPSPVNVRVVAATSEVEIEEAMQRGDLRRPFYYRFGLKLALPPLRDRREDIPLLAFYFLDQYAAAFGARTRSISRRALQKLTDYDWPGNVRELENHIKKAIDKEKEILFSWDLEIETAEPPAPDDAQTAIGSALDDTRGVIPSPPFAPKTMDEIEKEKIMEALETTQGNVTRASELLGYKSRQTILNKMDRYGISREYGDFREPRL